MTIQPCITELTITAVHLWKDRKAHDHVWRLLHTVGLRYMQFDLVTEVLKLMISVKKQAASELGNGALSGLAIVANSLLQQLPIYAQAMCSSSALQSASHVVQKLSTLVKAASVTCADAVTFRSPALASLLAQFGILATWKRPGASYQRGHALPVWRIHVQVRSEPAEVALKHEI